MANGEISLPQEVYQKFDRIRGSSAQIARQAADRTVDAVAETTQRAKDALMETADRTVDTVSTVAEQAKDSLLQTAANVFDRTASATNTAFHKLSETTSTAIGNSAVPWLDKQFDVVKHWMGFHPSFSWLGKLFSWGITHPIFSLIAIILGIFILRQFLKALARFLEQLFLFTLEAPFKFGQFLMGLFLKPFSKLTGKRVTSQPQEANLMILNGAMPGSIAQNQKERLIYILNRLEAIRQEQNQLLQEATSILGSNENLLK